jgi:hypothetical protein
MTPEARFGGVVKQAGAATSATRAGEVAGAAASAAVERPCASTVASETRTVVIDRADQVLHGGAEGALVASGAPTVAAAE